MVSTRQWFYNILYLFVLLVMAYLFITTWLARNNARYVPGLGRYKLITILSDSMKPAIRAGDAIVVDSGATAHLGKGDIVTYWFSNGATLLTHRIVETRREDEKVFYTKGDANTVLDGEPVRRNHIVGKYLFRIPRGGFLLAFIHTKAGFFLMIIFPLIMAVCLECRKMYLSKGYFLNGKIQP